jgi:FkbM family methyltransferase
MKYDFVEIGASIWDTCVDHFGLKATGLLVEPMPNLFKAIPSSDTVKKENVAVSSYDGVVKLYTYDDYSPEKEYRYMPLDEISKHGYGTQGFGWDVSSIDLNKERNVTGEIEVKCLTLKSLLEKYNITEIDLFKVDTEGHENVIIRQLTLLMDAGLKINKEIYFEYNHLSDMAELDEIADNICKSHGFKKGYNGPNISLKKEKG